MNTKQKEFIKLVTKGFKRKKSRVLVDIFDKIVSLVLVSPILLAFYYIFSDTEVSDTVYANIVVSAVMAMYLTLPAVFFYYQFKTLRRKRKLQEEIELKSLNKISENFITYGSEMNDINKELFSITFSEKKASDNEIKKINNFISSLLKNKDNKEHKEIIKAKEEEFLNSLKNRIYLNDSNNYFDLEIDEKVNSIIESKFANFKIDKDLIISQDFKELSFDLELLLSKNKNYISDTSLVNEFTFLVDEIYKYNKFVSIETIKAINGIYITISDELKEIAFKNKLKEEKELYKELTII